MEADNCRPLDLTRIANYCIYEKTTGTPYHASFQYFNDLAKDHAIKSIQLIISGNSISPEEADSLLRQMNDLAGSEGAWIVGDDSLPRLVRRG